MQMGRRFDPLYDPLYKTSDGRAADFLEQETFSDHKQQRLPSYKNMFSALPERYPSYSLRSQSIEAARREAERQFHPTRTSSASPTRSARSMKLSRAATSPQKPSTSPSLGRHDSTPPSKRLLQKGRLEKAAKDVYPVAVDHAKLKAVFEKALPPLTDSKSLAARKQLLEAWESAEWESREAQIRAMQEAQLAEFEDSIKAKHAQAEQSLSQRLSTRWAIEQSSADAAAAKVAHQGMRKAQHLAKVRQREGERLTSAGLGGFDAMLGAVGHGMTRARKDKVKDMQATLGGPAPEAVIVSRTGYAPTQAYRPDDQPVLKGLRPPGRKELAYAGHLNRVHQAILASNKQAAEDLAALAPENGVEPDILIVDDSPGLEQAEQPDESYELMDTMDIEAALEPLDVDGAVADSAALLRAEAPHQRGVMYALADESPEHTSLQQTADLVLEDDWVYVAGRQHLADNTEAKAADEYGGEAVEHAPPIELTDGLAAEIAAMTDELLDTAIYEDLAMTAQQPQAQEEAIGAALEATIEDLVSITEAVQPRQLPADAEDLTNKGLKGSEENGDAEADSVVTTHEGSPVINVLRPRSPDTAKIRIQKAQSNNIADTSLAEQQALTNSIYSGGYTRASPADTVNEFTMRCQVSADCSTETLDSLIRRQYQPKQLPDAQGSKHEDITAAERSTAADQVTGDSSDSPEQGLAQDAAVLGSLFQLAIHENMPSLDFAESPKEEQREHLVVPTSSRGDEILSQHAAPASNTEDAATSDARDAEHGATPEAPMQEPSHGEMPYEATDMDTHDRIGVTLTQVSPGEAYTPAIEPDVAQPRSSTKPHTKEEEGRDAHITLQQAAEGTVAQNTKEAEGLGRGSVSVLEVQEEGSSEQPAEV